MKDHGETTFVTGLRAWAVGGVLLVHAGGAGLNALGPLGRALVDLGASGVVAFFVFSGFSVAASYDAAGGFGRYLFLRYFRLAPLYYLWLLLVWTILGRQGYWARSLGVAPWSWDLGLHALFLHGLTLQTANSVLGVEWSLSVEVCWYLLLPFMLWLARRSRFPWMPVLGLILYVALRAVHARRLQSDPLFVFQVAWHPLSYAFSFALGVFAFVHRSQVVADERRLGVRVALGLFAWQVLSAAYLTRWVVPPLISISLVSALLLLYADSADGLVRALFLSRTVLVIGSLSYGLYLSHLFVLNFLPPVGDATWAQSARFAAVLALGSALSWVTWSYVEEPSQTWAKRFWPAVNKSA